MLVVIEIKAEYNYPKLPSSLFSQTFLMTGVLKNSLKGIHFTLQPLRPLGKELRKFTFDYCILKIISMTVALPKSNTFF